MVIEVGGMRDGPTLTKCCSNLAALLVSARYQNVNQFVFQNVEPFKADADREQAINITVCELAIRFFWNQSEITPQHAQWIRNAKRRGLSEQHCVRLAGLVDRNLI